VDLEISFPKILRFEYSLNSHTIMARVDIDILLNRERIPFKSLKRPCGLFSNSITDEEK